MVSIKIAPPTVLNSSKFQNSDSPSNYMKQEYRDTLPDLKEFKSGKVIDIYSISHNTIIIKNPSHNG